MIDIVEAVAILSGEISEPIGRMSCDNRFPAE